MRLFSCAAAAKSAIALAPESISKAINRARQSWISGQKGGLRVVINWQVSVQTQVLDVCRLWHYKNKILLFFLRNFFYSLFLPFVTKNVKFAFAENIFFFDNKKIVKFAPDHVLSWICVSSVLLHYHENASDTSTPD
jgi:hypothetical protein